MGAPIDDKAEALAEQARVLLTQARDEAQPLIERLQALKAENLQLTVRIGQIETDHRVALQQYERAEAAASELSALAVASHRLLDAVAHGEVAHAIGEIITNLVGSEEYALFGADETARCLMLMKSTGVDTVPLLSVPFGQGRIGTVAATRLAWVHEGEQPAPDDINACLPLLAGNELVGALAIFRLLPQKPRLGPKDRSVLELLSAHGGLALRMGAALAKR